LGLTVFRINSRAHLSLTLELKTFSGTKLALISLLSKNLSFKLI